MKLQSSVGTIGSRPRASQDEGAQYIKPDVDTDAMLASYEQGFARIGRYDGNAPQHDGRVTHHAMYTTGERVKHDLDRSAFHSI